VFPPISYSVWGSNTGYHIEFSHAFLGFSDLWQFLIPSYSLLLILGIGDEEKRHGRQGTAETWRGLRCHVCSLISWNNNPQSLSYQTEKEHCRREVGKWCPFWASEIRLLQVSFVPLLSRPWDRRTGNDVSFEGKSEFQLSSAFSCYVADQHFTKDTETRFLKAVSRGFRVSFSKAGITESSARWAESHPAGSQVLESLLRKKAVFPRPALHLGFRGKHMHFSLRPRTPEHVAFIVRGQKCSPSVNSPSIIYHLCISYVGFGDHEHMQLKENWN